jgi:sugar phosphate isomerase/epimerase
MYKNLNAQALGISGQDSELIELALSYGFKGLTLNLADFAAQVETQGMARASRSLISARLKMGSFRLPVEWNGADDQYQSDLAKLPKFAELAREMHCSRAVTLIEPADDHRPYHENFEFHRKRLAELADALAPYKISLGVEFLAPMSERGGKSFQFIQSFDEVLQLLKMVGAPNLGVALDLWHWHLSGGTLETLRSLAPEKVITVALADAEPETTAATAQAEQRRLPGDGGAVDIPAVLVTLAEMGYDGPVSPEPDRGQFGSASRQNLVKQAGAALDSVWKAAGLSTSGKLTPVRGA